MSSVEVNKVSRKRRKSWALIWWVDDGRKDIIPTSNLQKDARTVGAMTTLV